MLQNVKILKDRFSLTKFRLSHHKLTIEKERHLKVPMSEKNALSAYLLKKKNIFSRTFMFTYLWETNY